MMPRLPNVDDRDRGNKMREAILDALRREARVNHIMTVREIGMAVGLSSSSTVHAHLKVLQRQRKIRMPTGLTRSIEVIRTPEEICTCCGGSGWAYMPTFPPKPPITIAVREYSMSGELLNDELELLNHSLHPFDPDKYYRVREGIGGREVIGLWDDVPGTELIGDKRPSSETSFGH